MYTFGNNGSAMLKQLQLVISETGILEQIEAGNAMRIDAGEADKTHAILLWSVADTLPIAVIADSRNHIIFNVFVVRPGKSDYLPSWRMTPRTIAPYSVNKLVIRKVDVLRVKEMMVPPPSERTYYFMVKKADDQAFAGIGRWRIDYRNPVIPQDVMDILKEEYPTFVALRARWMVKRFTQEDGEAVPTLKHLPSDVITWSPDFEIIERSGRIHEPRRLFMYEKDEHRNFLDQPTSSVTA